MFDTKEKSRKYLRDYYLRNRERILERSRTHYLDNKKQIHSRQKDYRKTIQYKSTRLHKKYDISIEKAMELLSVTRCEICGSEEELHTDHSHITGKVRGRLCMRCNRAMGAFKDSPDILQKAINYLHGNGEK